jgi:hypothetical protein
MPITVAGQIHVPHLENKKRRHLRNHADSLARVALLDTTEPPGKWRR